MTRTMTEEGLELGGSAPAFHLPAADGNRYTLDSFEGADVLVVVFISNGCPTVRGYDERLNALQRDFEGRGVRVVAINSNSPHLSPADTLEEMVTRTAEGGYRFPYLRDEGGRTARHFGAVSTPHAFVFDGSRKLRYRGRVDDARNPEWVNRSDLREAVDELLGGKEVSVPETPPFGCAIVW